MRQAIAGLLILSCAFCHDVSATDVQKQISCSGRVVDDSNKPVEGAKVTLYKFVADAIGQETKKLIAEARITDKNGSFSFSANAPSEKQNRLGMLVAIKDGYAIAWDKWNMREDKITTLRMDAAHILSGVVVDETGKPVRGAEVRISMLLKGKPSNGPYEADILPRAEVLDSLVSKTDSNGYFAFSCMSADESAEFSVKKPGKVTIDTFNPSLSGNSRPGQYTIQSKDIRIVQPDAATIEGRVIEKNTDKPIGGVKLVCEVENPHGFYGTNAVTSADDGTFSFETLAAKTYVIRGAPSLKETKKWVIKPVPIAVKAGETARVVVEASKGGILEITLRNSEKKPVAGVTVYVKAKDSKRAEARITDANGVATIRLLPGEYTLIGALKEGFQAGKREEQTVIVEEGKTIRAETEL
jgi:uncharacterized GH25 family protein